jgi:hypothetical protein
MRTKICTKCKKELSLECFTKAKNLPGGFKHHCRDCCSIYSKKNYHKNYLAQKKRMEKRYRERKEQSPWIFLYHGSKSRAKNRKIEFNITEDDIKDLWVDKCPILGIPLYCAVFESGGERGNKAKPCENSPTLDRIDPNLGYVKGNIMIISYRANMIKNCGTALEHRKIADYLDSLYVQTP